MACELWTAKLDTYLDGELPREEELALREHLRTCPGCASQALDRIQTKRSIQAAAMRFQPDPAFRARIRQSVAAPPARRAWKWNWPPLLALSAACVVLIAALWITHLQNRAREQHLVSELVDLHVSTLASSTPVDVVSSDRHTVKPWFEGKLPFTFDLPDLQGSQFSLVGGRTSYLNQSVGAELIFRLRQHNISVFIFQKRAVETGCAENTATSELNFHLRNWSKNGLCYFVIGDVSADDLQKLATLLKS